MKITKNQLKQIITEELEAVMIDEGFMSSLKKMGKKVTGSYGGELKKYDPWAINITQGAWNGFMALINAMHEQNIRVDLRKKLKDIQSAAATLAPHVKKAGGSYTAKFLTKLSKVSSAPSFLSLGAEHSVGVNGVVRVEIRDMYEAATGQGDRKDEQGAKDFLNAIQGLDYNGDRISGVDRGFRQIISSFNTIMQYNDVDVEAVTKAGETLKKIEPKLEAAKEALAQYEPSERELEHFAKNPAMKRLGHSRPPLQGTKLGKHAHIWMQSNSLGVSGEPSGKFRKISQQYSDANKAINDAVAGFKG